MYAIASRTGLDFTVIPYKGSAPAMTALLAGDVDMMLDVIPTHLQYIERGRIKALMQTGAVRSAVLPAVPAAPEIKGMDFVTGTKLSFWAPAGTPDPIVQKLSAEIAAASNSKEFIAKFRVATNNVEPVGSTPAELRREIERDMVLYTEMARKMNYQPE